MDYYESPEELPIPPPEPDPHVQIMDFLQSHDVGVHATMELIFNELKGGVGTIGIRPVLDAVQTTATDIQAVTNLIKTVDIPTGFEGLGVALSSVSTALVSFDERTGSALAGQTANLTLLASGVATVAEAVAAVTLLVQNALSQGTGTPGTVDLTGITTILSEVTASLGAMGAILSNLEAAADVDQSAHIAVQAALTVVDTKLSQILVTLQALSALLTTVSNTQSTISNQLTTITTSQTNNQTRIDNLIVLLTGPQLAVSPPVAGDYISTPVVTAFNMVCVVVGSGERATTFRFSDASTGATIVPNVINIYTAADYSGYIWSGVTRSIYPTTLSLYLALTDSDTTTSLGFNATETGLVAVFGSNISTATYVDLLGGGLSGDIRNREVVMYIKGPSNVVTRLPVPVGVRYVRIRFS